MTVLVLRKSDAAQDMTASAIGKPGIVNCRSLLRAGTMHLFLFKSADSEWNEDNRLAILKPANNI